MSYTRPDFDGTSPILAAPSRLEAQGKFHPLSPSWLLWSPVSVVLLKPHKTMHGTFLYQNDTNIILTRVAGMIKSKGGRSF